MALASVESREMPVQALRHDAVTRTPENNSGGLWRHFRFSGILAFYALRVPMPDHSEPEKTGR